MKQLAYTAVTLTILTNLVACTHGNTTTATEKKEAIINDSLMKMIRIDTVQYSNDLNQLKLSGQIGFDENHISKVFSNSSGQVMDVKVSFGDRVRKGQVLSVIKSADIAGDYSDRATATADVKIAKRQLDNAKSLYESGISSEREYEEAKENYEKTVAVLGKVNSLININGKGHTAANGLYYITSPADGYIVEKKINTGSFIRSDMADNIFTISDLKDIWVWANVYETDISKVKEGMQAEITTLAYPDKVFAGKVDKVSELLDPENKSLKVRITLPNTDLLLKPEMFASVVIKNNNESKTVAVPASSIINDNGKSFVVVYNNNNDVKIKQVNPMKTVGSTTYLGNELQPGEKVISQNQILLYNALTE